MKIFRMAINCLFLFTIMAIPVRAHAEDYYVGYSFIHMDTTHFCVIARTRAYDGSFTLAEADGLYKIIADQVDGLGLTQTIQINHTLPSVNHSNGVTGESLASAFLSMGVQTCTVNSQPVDAMVFISAFNCIYQNENQMCVRLYVDTGVTDLTVLGVPRGPAAIGGIFIKREVWNAAKALILANPNAIPSLPLVGSIGAKINPLLISIETEVAKSGKMEDLSNFFYEDVNVH